MNCYFCNLPISKLYSQYRCITCNCSFIIYDDLSDQPIRFIHLHYKEYYVFFDFYYKFYALYKGGLFHRILYKFNSFPNITPQNIESKINTILAFL